jgi:MoaA/NifB/PqqE/SkfB family radical SAM enzyme
MVDVSLDSLARFDESKKDMTRRGPLFDALFSGREKYGFAVKTNQVLTQKNKDQLESMLDFADKNRILLSVRLAMPSPIPLSLPEQEGIYFTPNNEQDIRAVDRIVDTILIRKRKGDVTSETPDFYKTMKKWIRGENNLWKCDAGSYHITINNDGRVMPCELLPSSYGIHFRELTEDYAKKFKQQTKATLAQCQDNCLAAAYFCGSDYRRHPWKLFTQGFLKLTG